MPTGLYLHGLAIGFAIAAAIGPIALLCIRRTLAEGRAIGLATGLGAATADGLYAAVAAFGLTAISGALIEQRRALAIVGGALLLVLAARTWPRVTARGPDDPGPARSARDPGPVVGEATTRRGVPSELADDAPGSQAATDGTPPLAPARNAGGARRLVTTWATTLGLTVTNPATIVSFAAAFVGFGLVGHGGPGAAVLVLGVASGSAAWWLLLVGAVGALRPRVGPVALRRVGVASSAMIALLGLAAMWGGLSG